MTSRPLVNGRAQVVMGDATSHGGKVISGSPTTFFGPSRIPIARVGDMTSCPLCPPHVFPIVEGDPIFTDNYMRVALHGHKTACGATLVAVNGSFNQALKVDNGKDASTQEPPNGFSDSEKKQIHEALQAQKKLLEVKLSELKRWSESDQKKFTLAFGDDSELSRLKIKRRLDSMLTLNSKTGVGQFKKANNKDTPDIDPSSLYAYVHPDDVKRHSIYLGDAFWRAPLQGEDSKAGTLTHEMSHFEDIGDTADYFASYKQGTSIYGMEASHALAKAKPELAVKHADSFEYWVEDQ